VFKAFDLAPASTHDIHYLNDIEKQFQHCVLIGDKGYISQGRQQDLFERRDIRLETPKRVNQKAFKPFNPFLRKTRKRIETLFSQLADQFMIRRNYAKSIHGLATRVLAKITALTCIQWINQLNQRPINQLKIVIA